MRSCSQALDQTQSFLAVHTAIPSASAACSVDRPAKYRRLTTCAIRGRKAANSSRASSRAISSMSGSLAVLALMIDSQADRRAGKAIGNFAHQLSAPQSDLVQRTLKDPYSFDFLTLDEPFHERYSKRNSSGTSKNSCWNSARLRPRGVRDGVACACLSKLLVPCA